MTINQLIGPLRWQFVAKQQEIKSTSNISIRTGARNIKFKFLRGFMCKDFKNIGEMQVRQIKIILTGGDMPHYFKILGKWRDEKQSDDMVPLSRRRGGHKKSLVAPSLLEWNQK